jgi:hypothetical protein
MVAVGVWAVPTASVGTVTVTYWPTCWVPDVVGCLAR